MHRRTTSLASVFYRAIGLVCLSAMSAFPVTVWLWKPELRGEKKSAVSRGACGLRILAYVEGCWDSSAWLEQSWWIAMDFVCMAQAEDSWGLDEVTCEESSLPWLLVCLDLSPFLLLFNTQALFIFSVSLLFPLTCLMSYLLTYYLYLVLCISILFVSLSFYREDLNIIK